MGFFESPFFIVGPCALEGDGVNLPIAEALSRLSGELGFDAVFKGSFDKANRTAPASPRGPGLADGVRQLERVREATGLGVLTDIHESDQVESLESIDYLQIPAFLCRQTDLIAAAARSGKPLVIKKGQWADPVQIAGAVAKAREFGATDIAVAERGTFFGYGDLVVDFRNFRRIRESCHVPLIYDVTHSVQQPGRGEGSTTGGTREEALPLALAAAAAGADGFYIESHPDPDRALSDSHSQVPLDELGEWVMQILTTWRHARGAVHDS